jgi:glycosyltransferase involved in cell wall biosynthesis
MRLALVTASLGRGGAERVMSILASAWAETDHDITILILNKGDVPAYPLHPAIKLKNLQLPSSASPTPIHALARTIKKVLVLRNAIRNLGPDLILSFIDYANILTLLAARPLEIPVIVSERIDPSHYRIGAAWEFLRRKTYSSASAVVCQTQVTLQRFEQRMRLKGRVIPNPVVLPEITKAPSTPRFSAAAHAIAAMGRLVPQKGFDLLIDAFSLVALAHPDWNLLIAGDGPLRAQLEQQTNRLDLSARVVFTGAVGDPFALLVSADLFVLSSRFEGFPNVLCEAMACGLPVISFDCPAGPQEIIRDGIDGLLVPAENVSALAGAMDDLIKDPVKRTCLASRAPEVADRFSKNRVLAIWEQLFNEVLQAPASEHPVSSSLP